MAGWEDIDADQVGNEPPDPFKAARAKVDPIVFRQTDSNPELRWTPDMAPKRPDPVPPPKRVSTGKRVEQWVPGGEPNVAKNGHKRAHDFGTILKIVAATMLPLGLIAGVVMLFLRAYGLA